MTIKLSFVSNEVIVPGTPLYVHTLRPVKKGQENECVKLFKGKKELEHRVTIHENAIQLSTADLPSGRYRVKINAFHDEEGQCLNEHPMRVIIFIRKMCGQVSSDLRILHVVHLAVGELSTARLKPGEAAPDGTSYLETVRLAHRQTHNIQSLAFDADGKAVDGDQILQDVHKRRHAKFGTIEERLWELIQEADREAKLDVVVWPKFDRDKADLDWTKAPDGHHILAFQRPKAELMTIIKGFEADIQEHFELPPITTKLTKDQVQQLAKSEDVCMIFSGEQQAQCCGSSASLLETNRGDRAQSLGYSGKGVKVAIHEFGKIYPENAPYVQYAAVFTEDPKLQVGEVPPGAVDYHLAMTSAIVRSVKNNKPYGYAPGCTLYIANEFGYQDERALYWAIITNKCTIVNESYGDKLSYGYMKAGDVLRDYYASHPPFPLIVQAGGNMTLTSGAFVAPKGYNGLKVGGHNESGDEMARDEDGEKISAYKNPLPINQRPTTDRELPDIIARGENVDIIGHHATGTSFAAPAVSGVAALIQGIHPFLQQSPVACRAILYTSAGRQIGNYSDATWSVNVSEHHDLEDGAGILDGEAAVKIARNRAPRNGPAQMLPGWDVGFLKPADFLPNSWSKFSYKVRTPNQKSLTFRAALAWNSTVASGAGPSTLTINNNLFVYNSGTRAAAGFSASFDNSYEIVEFPALPNHVYEIYIQQTDNPTGANTWYGIAWAMFIKGDSV